MGHCIFACLGPEVLQLPATPLPMQCLGEAGVGANTLFTYLLHGGGWRREADQCSLMVQQRSASPSILGSKRFLFQGATVLRPTTRNPPGALQPRTPKGSGNTGGSPTAHPIHHF